MKVKPGSTSVRLQLLVEDAANNLEELDYNEVLSSSCQLWENNTLVSEQALTLIPVANDTWAEGNIEYVGSGEHYLSVPNSFFSTDNIGRIVIADIVCSTQKVTAYGVVVDYHNGDLYKTTKLIPALL